MINAHQDAVGPSIVCQRGVGRELNILQLVSEPRCLQQGIAIRGIAHLALGLAEPDQRAAALGVVGGADQFDRVGQEPGRLARSKARQCLFACTTRYSAALPTSTEIVASRQCSASSASR